MGKGRSPLQGRQAEKIAKKLNAEIDRKGPHIRAIIRHNGFTIAQFGWRHDKTAGNGHIPKQLNISERDALEIARCNKYWDDYVALLKDKNLFPQ